MQSSAQPRSGGAPPERAPSPRLQLARLSLEAALAVRGVVGAHSGPVALRATVEGRERVAGVVVAAIGGGRFSVELHLVGGLVPLHPLAERVRDRVERAAAKAGLRDALGPVDITFEDVLADGSAPAPEEAA